MVNYQDLPFSSFRFASLQYEKVYLGVVYLGVYLGVELLSRELLSRQLLKERPFWLMEKSKNMLKQSPEGEGFGSQRWDNKLSMSLSEFNSNRSPTFGQRMNYSFLSPNLIALAVCNKSESNV